MRERDRKGKEFVARYMGEIKVAVEETHELIRRVGSQRGFEEDALLQGSARDILSRIGEAARQLPDGHRAKYQDVDWQSLIDIRDMANHEYANIRIVRIWRVLNDEIVPLGSKLKLGMWAAALPPERE
ncbi:MAG: DUF86 domain-containing protein [Ilumatobacteraceae bacterium]